jgi:hypothetical protein
MRRSLPIIAVLLGTLAATPAFAWDHHRPSHGWGWRPAPAWNGHAHGRYGGWERRGHAPHFWRESWRRPAPPRGGYRGDPGWNHGRRW